jgi:hypothetical protein
VQGSGNRCAFHAEMDEARLLHTCFPSTCNESCLHASLDIDAKDCVVTTTEQMMGAIIGMMHLERKPLY